MKKLSLIVLMGGMLFLTAFQEKTHKDTSQSIVVIELFTSQGCSSCPSADKLLSSIVNNVDGKEIFGLSFHVSYWNRLGWKDPYSSEAFTDRQRKYGAVMNLSTIYTPQMVVNGKHEFVGSSKSKADHYIESVLQESSKAKITMDVSETNKDQISVNYALKGNPDGNLLNFAIVEKHTENYVSRGENRGLNLKHENVVRTFKTIYAEQSGNVELNVDDTIELKNCLIVAYLQNKNNLEIYGASKVELGVSN